MKQLTGLDAAFLAVESRAVLGHVGSLWVLDPSSAPVPPTLDRVTRLIESRLPLVPVFRQRLLLVPLGLDEPYWIEDADFDIEFHVRELALPQPGSDRQLADQVARLHSRPLDRSRPLWELYLISGLRDGRVALYTKIHHSAIDGVSGNDLLTALLDVSPEGRGAAESGSGAAPPGAPPHDAPPRTPGQAEMLARGAVSLLRRPVRLARLSASLLRAGPGLLATIVPRLPAVLRLRGGDDPSVVAMPGLRAPRTPFNRPITQHRRCGFCEVPLDEVKRAKHAAGVTVNDVVMAVCAGALRRWLIDHDALPAVPLAVAVPVSVRGGDRPDSYGNRVSAMWAALPTHLEDPLDRLRATHHAMRAAKEQLQATPAEWLTDVTQFPVPALVGQAARLAARLRLVERMSPINLVISNIPGPRVPLYFAGAELLAYYPLSAVWDGQGLNLTVISYRDRLFFGLAACRELVPDVDRMADYLRDETETLVKAVAVAADGAPGRRAGRVG